METQADPTRMKLVQVEIHHWCLSSWHLHFSGSPSLFLDHVLVSFGTKCIRTRSASCPEPCGFSLHCYLRTIYSSLPMIGPQLKPSVCFWCMTAGIALAPGSPSALQAISYWGETHEIASALALFQTNEECDPNLRWNKLTARWTIEKH